MKCGDNLCTNNNYFPLYEFPNNTLIVQDGTDAAAGVTRPVNGYFASDNCCYRVCSKHYNLCGHNQEGCYLDEDCQHGYFCNTNLDKPR